MQRTAYLAPNVRVAIQTDVNTLAVLVVRLAWLSPLTWPGEIVTKPDFADVTGLQAKLSSDFSAGCHAVGESFNGANKRPICRGH